MKITMKFSFTVAFTALLALASPIVFAQTETEVTTDPVGFVSKNLLANSDTYIAPPLIRGVDFQSAIELVAGSVVTVAGSPDFQDDQWVYSSGVQPNTYYGLFISGDRTGSSFVISANGGNTLTLDLNGDDISTVVQGDAIRIIPFWTLGTLFPAAEEGVSFIGNPSGFNI